VSGPIRRIVLASANPGKAREFAALIAAHGLTLVPQTALGIASIPETGATFEDNALLKARHAAQASGLAALADDSGLEVEALRGAPGVHSARYAGESATDQANNAKLLEALRDVPAGQRAARYRCVLALVRGPLDPAPLIAHGGWSGHIAFQPAGASGFGYDPLFVPDGCALSAAQLPAEQKNLLSHRGQAVAELSRQLARKPW
jgi:XTP/dITP diphosphohydrolase